MQLFFQEIYYNEINNFGFNQDWDCYNEFLGFTGILTIQHSIHIQDWAAFVFQSDLLVPSHPSLWNTGKNSIIRPP